MAGSRPHVCAHPVTAQHSGTAAEFITGGLLEFWSLDNPDVARGRKYRRIIVDEAAMVPSLMDVWQYALRPTLADYQGDAWFCLHRRGATVLADVAMGTRCHDAGMGKLANAVKRQPATRTSELDEMRRTMPERTYRQEIEAAFVEDGGGVFRRVQEAATADKQTVRRGDRTYVAGLGLGTCRMTFPSY